MFPPALQSLISEPGRYAAERLSDCCGSLLLGWSLPEYCEEVWEEFSDWFARMGPEEYLVLAGMAVVISFFLLFSGGVRR